MNPTIKTWQQELSEGFSNTHELCDYLNISPANILTSAAFPLRVPREFADRMEKGNLNDPLLKQILPITDENIISSGFSNDPVGDISATTETGVIHKYQSRVLLITTGGCAINCRYCFRKNFPYSDFQLSTQKLDQAIQYIAMNKDISEVILSGGDPLLLNDQKLFSLIHQLENIAHLKRIRIHSRIPIVLPSRITNAFCTELSSINKQIVLVVHSNHQNELNAQVKSACKKIKECHITLLNQSVLLKGINDDAQQLCSLSEKLFDFGIMPYYLHLLDKATGTRHFEVEQNTAIALMDQIKRELPGYLVPKLVRERPGAANKIVIT
ncbi:MAG: EF-P beta-lysylation protein EpmB [Methylococcales bacterium]|nr:EF-P beta-lysylation protein EpmB [Methylococcales bacterium]MCK5478277.1 EF-P beta-lysylation protein EpmB [Methylococcales bacterium]